MASAQFCAHKFKNWYTAIGIKRLRNNLQPLLGRLKTEPEDFEVTEVGPDGRLVDPTRMTVPQVPKPILHQEVKPAKVDLSPLWMESFSVDEGMARSNLDSLLSKKILEPVMELKAALDAGVKLKTDISLGTFTDRVLRTKVQAYLKRLDLRLYPYIRDEELKVGYDPTLEQAREYLDEQDAIALTEFLQQRSDTRAKLRVGMGIEDSSKRKRIHQMIRKLRVRVEAKTRKTEMKSYIEVQHRQSKKRRREDDQGSMRYPGYWWFGVRKRLLESNRLITLLAEALEINKKCITVAGTKDKVAITTQRLCVPINEVPNPKAILDILETSPNLKTCGLEQVGSIFESPDALRLGDLEGNHFRIVLRDLQFREEWKNGKTLVDVLDENVKALRDNGFLNYFGPQRFGVAGATYNYKAGLHILKGDDKAAVLALLEPNMEVSLNDLSGESFDRESAKRIFWSDRDCKAALDYCAGRDHVYEAVLLKALKNFGESEEGYQAALRSLGFRTRKFLCNQYQSLLWNNLIGSRSGEMDNPEEEVPLLSDECADMYADAQITVQELERARQKKLIAHVTRRVVAMPKNLTYSWNGEELELDFTLPSSCYATCMLMELLGGPQEW